MELPPESSPCEPSRAGCGFYRQKVYGNGDTASAGGQPTSCDAEPVATGRVRFPRSGEVWQVFACDFHRRYLTDPRTRDLEERDRAVIAERAAQYARALAGGPWEPPSPLSRETRSQGAAGATQKG